MVGAFAAMDTTNRRPQLPALSYLDVDKAKREEAYQHRNPDTSQAYHSAPAASPSYQFPPPPPQPYSHPTPQHANSWPGSARTTVQTPPDSRRTSGDDNENIIKASRQSLPSLSEALGESSYSSSTSAPQPPLQSTAPQSPPSAARRSFNMEPPQPQNPYASNTSSLFSSYRQDSAGPQSYAPPDPAKPAYAPSPDIRQPLHIQTAQPPRTQQPGSSYTQTTSPQYEQPSSQSAGSMGPPSYPYGYTPYPPRYAQPPTSSSHSAGPIYQPSASYAYTAPTTPPSAWKSESRPRYAPDDRPGANAYSESVKRHLDIHDLEMALNEIAQTSGIMLDFSRRYGDRMHQNARSGPSLSTLPSMVEVEDMINKSRIQLDSLTKIREVILTQQAAYEQQMADQRQQHKAYSEQPPQAHEQGAEGMKGEFAGSDTKKRRGRAAPPGRCHSCNRAETPEWRRGPDGARTLCNACGLHYAKLTRKQTGANKAAAVGSSNLRPKES